MLFQYGTMAGIMEGAFSGSITLEELLKHGDFGIGTFDGIDGEMIIVDGKIYKTDYYGNSTIQPTSTTTPFASITTFKAEYKKVDNYTFNNLVSKVNDYLNPNYFYAIKITGTFKKIHTRSPEKQEKPYPPLLKVLESQKEEIESRLLMIHHLLDDNEIQYQVIEKMIPETIVYYSEVKVKSYSDMMKIIPSLKKECKELNPHIKLNFRKV